MTEPNDARARELLGLVDEVETLGSTLTLNVSDSEAVQAFADAVGRLLAAGPDPAILQALDVEMDVRTVRPDWESEEARAIRDALARGDAGPLRSALLAQGIPDAEIDRGLAALLPPEDAGPDDAEPSAPRSSTG